MRDVARCGGFRRLHARGGEHRGFMETPIVLMRKYPRNARGESARKFTRHHMRAGMQRRGCIGGVTPRDARRGN